MTAPYQLSAAELLAEQEVDPARGLTAAQVKERREKYGKNELVERGLKSPWVIFFEQLSSTLIMLLIGAALVSALLSDWEDAIAILVIVLLNALLGLQQEYKAEQAMAALKRLAVPHVRVRRDGHVFEINAPDLTVGDIVMLEAGSAIPADGRLLEAASLRVQEAALTGESETVEKDADLVLAGETALGDRRNMVFMGTAATYGRATMVVTAVGMQTELGHIATMIQSVQGEKTPLQRRLDQLGWRLAAVALTLVAVIFLMGYLRGETEKPHGWRTLLMTAVSLAVAAVPEGLSAVVTIALALGSQRMLARNALIRKLPAVETLGSVTTICSDKTGTLTRNQMTVTALDVAGRSVQVREEMRKGRLAFVLHADEVVTLEQYPSLALLLAAGALCNDAVVERADEGGEDELAVVGDPTEGALVMASERLGLPKQSWEALLPRVGEQPFDSERKRMSTVHRPNSEAASAKPQLVKLLPPGVWDAGHHIVFAKGALDSLLDVCTHVWDCDQRRPLDEQWRQRVQKGHNELAEQGMRVLGVAFRTDENPPAGDGHRTDWEQQMTLIGLVGMIDPPRPEAKEAIGVCQSAGIRVMMITGDHPLTARSIASQLGIDVAHGVVTGLELEKIADDDLKHVVAERSVYARVSPEHKLRLVDALQRQGEIVAMTGDGVNDAPALKQADIGVAMGITGTDVSKEAADMVLQDDNFATIVAAVEEGRVIFDNVRKFIRYLLSSNASEIWTMMLGPVLGMPLPLLPLQILWMNLATDGLPALALGVEPAERNIMRRPPRPTNESIFARGVGIDIIWIGLLMASVTIGVGYWSWSGDADGPWQTIIFTTLTFAQLALALAMRSERDSIFQTGWLTNKSLLTAVGVMGACHLAIIYVPFLQRFFNTQPLTAQQLLLCGGLSLVVFVGVEIEKVFRRWRDADGSAGPRAESRLAHRKGV